MRDIVPAYTIEMVYPLNSRVRIPFSCATIAQHIIIAIASGDSKSTHLHT